MTGFEQQISGDWGNHSTNWTTTTAPVKNYTLSNSFSSTQHLEPLNQLRDPNHDLGLEQGRRSPKALLDG